MAFQRPTSSRGNRSATVYVLGGAGAVVALAVVLVLIITLSGGSRAQTDTGTLVAAATDDASTAGATGAAATPAPSTSVPVEDYERAQPAPPSTEIVSAANDPQSPIASNEVDDAIEPAAAASSPATATAETPAATDGNALASAAGAEKPAVAEGDVAAARPAKETPAGNSPGNSGASLAAPEGKKPEKTGDLAKLPEMLRLEDLPAAVRRSKDSVCIIEHPLGSGTGFVVGENLVATNSHVVHVAYVEELQCHFSASGSTKCRAGRVLYEDPVRDLCLLEVQTDQPPIPIVADYVFRRGDKVVIVGNPAIGETDLVLRDAVTGGTMSERVHTKKCDYYQIDGAVNPGSSGGPAMNYDGAVVAVIAMKATAQGEHEIRSALRDFGDRLASRTSSAQPPGIAFGIPVCDLITAMDAAKNQSAAETAQAGELHQAKVVLQRLAFLGSVNLLKLQLNAPLQVRQQAAQLEQRIATGSIPAATLNKLKRVPMIPESMAAMCRQGLENEDVLKVLRIFENGLEDKVNQLSASDQIDKDTAASLAAVYRSVAKTKRYADKPPTTYNEYADAVNNQKDFLKTRLRQLSEKLELADEEEPAEH